MSESRERIDARGQACPAPVILVKKAVERGGFASLEILVDNEAARDNVTRFAGYSGLSVVSSSGTAPLITVVVAASATPDTPSPDTPSPDTHSPDTHSPNTASPESAAPTGTPCSGSAGLTVLIASDRFGSGDDALGALLMRGFVYALAEGETPPERIILMNHGVKLATAGSDSEDNLKRLAGSGVEILACGTCLEFLGLKDALAIGRVSNMYEIAGFLSSERVLSI